MLINGQNVLNLDFVNNLAMINGEDYALDSIKSPTRPNAFAQYGGPITFSRSTSGSVGTVTDSTGRVTYAPNNLLLYSEQFDNSANWQTVAVIPNANMITAPDGNLTADLLTEGLSSSVPAIYQNATSIANTVYTFSIYLKAGTVSWYRIWLFDQATLTNGGRAWFNLQTGVKGTVANTGTGTSINATMTPVGNGWYRCSVTTTIGSATLLRCQLNSADADNSGTRVSNSTVYAWGAQVEAVTYQTSPRTYIPTTTAAYYGPRFDYDPVALTPNGLLIEEQRTNIITYSNVFQNAAWQQVLGATATDNQVISPDGTQNAATLTFTTTNANRLENDSAVAAVNGTTYTSSVWLKGSGTIHLNVSTTTGVGGSGEVAITLTSTWTRYQVSYTASSPTGNVRLMIIWRTGDTATTCSAYGAQLEAGAFATSYIPTTSAAVTRYGDVCTITGTNFANWYNQSQGTIIAAADVSSTGVSSLFNISDIGGGSERIQVRVNNTTVQYVYFTGGVAQAVISGSTVTTNTTFKIGGAYAVNDFAFSTNGGAAGLDNLGALALPIELKIGRLASSAEFLNGHIRSLQYYPLRLPNATLQALTT